MVIVKVFLRCWIFLFGLKLVSGFPLRHNDSSSGRTPRDLTPPHHQAQQDVRKVGGHLELLPDPNTVNVTGGITDILWKHGPNKLAEWNKKLGPDIDYYGRWKDPRVKLDKETGMLAISNMTEEDSGTFTVEINFRPSKTYRVEVAGGDAVQHNRDAPPTVAPPTEVPLNVAALAGGIVGGIVGILLVLLFVFRGRIKKSLPCCSEPVPVLQPEPEPVPVLQPEHEPKVASEEIKPLLTTNGIDASGRITSDSTPTLDEEVGPQLLLLGHPNEGVEWRRS